jgi:hypothetical protein
MRLPVLIAAFSLLSLTTQAQAFEPGVLVTASGDTLRGEIENNYWETNPVSIRFRAGSTAPIVSYTPQQLRAFQLGRGRYFRTELVPLDRQAETRIDLLQRGLSTNQQPETVFAEVLIDGPAPLLRFVLPDVTHYFVRREKQGYLELTERKYLKISRDGHLGVVDGNTYRIQLLQFFGDCPAAAHLVETARYTATDLAAVVQAYNQSCSGTGQAGQSFLAAAKPVRTYDFNLGLLAGAQFQSLRMHRSSSGTPEEAATFDGVDLTRQAQPVAGVYADLLLPNRKLALHADLTVSLLGKSGVLPAQGNVPAAEYRWKGTIATAHLGLRYFVPLGEQPHLFLGAGITLDRVGVTESSLRYGDGQTRTLGPYTIPRQSLLLELETTPYSTVGPLYAEIGFRRGPLTAALDVRTFSPTTFTDYAVVSRIYRDPQGQIVGLDLTQYKGRFWIANATVAYRLTKNRDVAAPASR